MTFRCLMCWAVTLCVFIELELWPLWGALTKLWSLWVVGCLDRAVISMGCGMLGQSYDSCGLLGLRIDLVGKLRSVLWLVSFEPIYLICIIVLHLSLYSKFTMFLLLYYYASWKFIYSCNWLNWLKFIGIGLQFMLCILELVTHIKDQI